MLVPATHVLAAGGQIGEVTGFMNTVAVRLLQTEIEALGLYHDRIDSDRGPNTRAAVGEALDARTGDLPDDWRSWSDRREAEDWWRIWEEQGWTSLGRVRNFDWMHVQATKL